MLEMNVEMNVEMRQLHNHADRRAGRVEHKARIHEGH